MMQWINTIFGIPLGYIMYACFVMLGNYGWAIILFTLLTKVVLFPISLASQKNAIAMAKIQPQLEEIKQRHYGNRDLIAEEQMKVYQREKYSPFLGCLPMLLQIPLILGLIQVIYNPLQHLFHLDAQSIARIGEQVAALPGMGDFSAAVSGAQLQMLSVIQGQPGAFDALRGTVAGWDALLARIQTFDLTFCGLNLAEVPPLAWHVLVIVPVLSGLSALVLCLVQNALNPLQREQGFVSKWGMTLFLIAFSTYFAFLVPAGIGLYWVAGNLLSALVTVVCTWIYDPRKYIDYTNRPQKTVLTREQKQQRVAAEREKHARERTDAKRFYALENKQLVFYSEGSGFYKYFRGFIEHVVGNSDLTVHYVTGDPADQVFALNHPQIVPYYIGDRELIPFMMKMEADMVVMTMPDLQRYHIKRSLVRKDIEYVYLDHGMTSYHMMLREGALDHFDTIFCYGPNHIAEVRATEKVYGLKEKKLVETGFPLLDELLERVAALPKENHATPQILVAPSWQVDNLLDYCLEPILAQLLGRGWRVIVRPHPEYIKRFPAQMASIQARWGDQMGDMFVLETNFAANNTVYESDVVITDWSSIAQEFSYATKRPSLFINTPVKIMNPNYERIGLVPLDLSLRDQIGVSLDVARLGTLADTVTSLLAQKDAYRQRIAAVVEENIFHVGHSAAVGGSYIIERLRERAQGRPTQS